MWWLEGASCWLAACSCAAQFATGAACGLDAVAWVLAAADAATASLAALDRRHLVEAACGRIASIEARCCRALGALCTRGSDVASGEGWAFDVAALACRGRVGDAPATQKVLSGEHAGALHWRPPSSLQEAWRDSVTEAIVRAACAMTGKLGDATAVNPVALLTKASNAPKV